MKMLKILAVACFAVFTLKTAAQSPIGTWKTIDDETGQAKSYVEIYESGGQLYGKITKLLQHGPDRVCEKCPGERKNQLVTGMVILENMARKKRHVERRPHPRSRKREMVHLRALAQKRRP